MICGTWGEYEMMWWMWIVIGFVALLFAGLFIISFINTASEDYKNKKNKPEEKGDIP